MLNVDPTMVLAIGFGPMELTIILAIALVLFGGKKIRNLGGDLGGAIKEFKTSVTDEEEEGKEDADKVSAEKTEEKEPAATE
jgi:sec-independent protein translocase protein TatA